MKSQIHERVLVATFVSVAALVPTIQAGLELAKGERPFALEVFMRAPTEDNLRDFESELEETSWLVRNVRPPMREWQYRLLDQPGSKVLRGREGWFFYKPGVDYLTKRHDIEADDLLGPTAAIHAITEFRDQLSKRGIRLLVVPVPGKASIYPSLLTAGLSRKTLSSPTRELISELSSRDVAVVDLFDALEIAATKNRHVALYLNQDTHWSPSGVEVVADAISDDIMREEWLADGTTEYRPRTTTVTRGGDIVRMIQLPNEKEFFSPETLMCKQVVLNDQLYHDDVKSPVLFLGDSFARIYQTDAPKAAGLIAHLALRLKTPIDSIVNDGGASTLVRQQLARRKNSLDGKKLVIWEFVERDIQFGTEGWHDVPLPSSVNIRR